MMTARTLPSRLRGKAPAAPIRLRLASEPGALPGWLLLGQVAGRELAFGAIGRFWTADIEWRPVDPADFAAFDEPGWGKIACHLLVRPDGPGRSVLTYECRTATTDHESRHAMGRYWWAIRPFVGYVLAPRCAPSLATPRGARSGRPRLVVPRTTRGTRSDTNDRP